MKPLFPSGGGAELRGRAKWKPLFGRHLGRVNMKIGFIGLGAMGTPMARNLVRAGHEVAVFNRTRARAEALEPEGAWVADTPAEAADDAEAVITMLAGR